jgi:endonuclease YncB( thermonuclease family)
MVKHLIALAIAAGVAGCDHSLSGTPSVHDGDTITVEGKAIRLNGLDAEELNEPHGVAARDAMRRIAGAYVECTPTLNAQGLGERSYNRIVATCVNARGQDIAALLIEQGLALDCPRFSHGRYRNNEPSGARRALIQKGYCRV